MAMVDLREQDPIQGHDVLVTITPYTSANTTGDEEKDSINNAFEEIMMKMVNQTETYLPLFSRVPRFLDGEIIIVWSASAGALSLKFIRETFGNAFMTSIKNGRTSRIKRSRRFSMSFTVATGEEFSAESHMRSDRLTGSTGTQRMSLLYCRCDTLSFGVRAGKGYAVNSWQGTAEALDDGYDSAGNNQTHTDPLAGR